MALSINSRAVLRSFAEHPDIFADIQSDLDELSRKLLVKQVKVKSMDATQLQKLFRVVSAETLEIIFDSMSDKEIVGLIKKVDPNSSHVKATDDFRPARAHIVEVAAGRAELSAKSVKTATPKKSKAPPKEPVSKIGEVLGSKVHSGAPRKPRKKN